MHEFLAEYSLFFYFVHDQVYIDVVEGSTLTADKLYKKLEELGILVMLESASRSVRNNKHR